MIDALTLDQIGLFLRVVDAGSFSAAARAERRATSAVTYAVHKMEDQLGLPLFDRSTYRPTLTEAGRALLPRARRVAEEVDRLRSVAHGIAGGLEPEIAIAVDAMFPMARLLDPLREFQARYPSVLLRMVVETLGGTPRLVADGECVLGLVSEFAVTGLDLVSTHVADLALMMVAAPSHPLARIAGPIDPEALKEHVQLVLADRSRQTGNRDYSVFSSQTWRLSDLGAKHEMLRAGLGFGSLPAHMAEGDVAAGRLVTLEIGSGYGRGPRFPMVLARRPDLQMGPATSWLFARLCASAAVLG
jgi:DNA-binding transcriptional LysR family regulator